MSSEECTSDWQTRADAKSSCGTEGGYERLSPLLQSDGGDFWMSRYLLSVKIFYLLKSSIYSPFMIAMYERHYKSHVTL